MRLGITGGTFDPIHLGHLIISEYIRQEYSLDKVLIMPTKNPPHKDEGSITIARHRVEMIRLSIEDNEFLELSDLEVNNSDTNYTVNTMELLRKIYGKEAELFFICGADSIRDMPKWKDPENLFSLCKIIAAYREASSKDEYLSGIKTLKENYNADIKLSMVPQIDISSSIIRERVKEGKTIKYFVNREVEQYIYKNNLYKAYNN